VGKFTAEERRAVYSIVSALSVKRIPDAEIMAEINKDTNKKISRQSLYNIKQAIKHHSYKEFNREGGVFY
jgi:hypothetical protein